MALLSGNIQSYSGNTGQKPKMKNTSNHTTAGDMAMDSILLLPGEYRITKRPEVIETLVGSCVSVCLYNTKTGQAAMNHFLQDQPAIETDCDIGHYGSTATEYIIQALLESDPVPGHYRAQVFGGAAVIKTNSKRYNIGQNNIEVAKKILTVHRIRITREEVGGTRGRRIKFDTSTNTVFCRFAGQIGKKYNKD
jgi:chemotaxis protein CheD